MRAICQRDMTDTIMFADNVQTLRDTAYQSVLLVITRGAQHGICVFSQTIFYTFHSIFSSNFLHDSISTLQAHVIPSRTDVSAWVYAVITSSDPNRISI
jgi:hypothetical protein